MVDESDYKSSKQVDHHDTWLIAFNLFVSEIHLVLVELWDVKLQISSII